MIGFLKAVGVFLLVLVAQDVLAVCLAYLLTYYLMRLYQRQEPVPEEAVNTQYVGV